MSGSIVLVESHYRSRSWFLALKNIGLTHIISVMPEEYQLFKKSGFNTQNILNLYYDGLQRPKKKKSVSFYEKFLNVNMNSIVIMDRTLRRKKRNYIENYLEFLLNEIDDFFLKTKPEIIFVEPTWTHEILICKFAKKYHSSIVAPVKDKLLPDRFLAFKDENHLDFYKNSFAKDTKYLSNEAFASVINDKPVQYFNKFNNRNKIDFRKFPKLLRLIKISIFNYRNPNIQNSVFSDIYIKIKSIFRSMIQISFFDFKKLREIKNKFILITLHVQPEASIDVVGSKYSNQIEFVRKISQTTPNKYIILVKEHSHAIGNRQSSFYKELLEIPRVVLLHPNENARETIRKSSLVISNTGTSSLEASILNIPSITTTSMFYNELLLQEKFNPYEENVGDLLKKQKSLSKNKIIEHLDRIYSGSFNGNCGDFQTDLDVLSDENIRKLQNSFLNLINSIKH